MREIATGFVLAEAPAWDAARERLVFSDAEAGGVWELRPDGPRCVLPHRRGIGGLVPHADGGLVVSGRNVAHKTDTETVVLGELDPAWGLTRFNDITADAAGRVYAGSLAWTPGDERPSRPGFLHLIEETGCRVVDDDIAVANGLAVSPDSSRLYFADTGASTVWCYALDGEGIPAPREAFATWPSAVPDGIAVAADGSLWVALGDGDECVAVFDAAGRNTHRYEVPGRFTTSLCFGGPDLTTVYVTTASTVLAFESDVPGGPVPLARVRGTVT